MQHFINAFTGVLHVPQVLGLFFLPIIAGYLLGEKDAGRRKISHVEKKLFAMSIITLTVCVYFYFSTKNPVWEYHFMALEVIALFVIAFLMKHVSLVRIALYIWAPLVFAWYVVSSTNSIISEFHKPSSLDNLTMVVEQVIKDSGNDPYTVQVKSPSIFFYEYDYLLTISELRNKPVPQESAKYVYILFPEKIAESDRRDFVNNRASDILYSTVKEWETKNGTRIVKREKTQ